MAANQIHKIMVKVQAPETTTVGKTANYKYKVKNRGITVFDGTIQIMLSWSQLNQNVYQPLNVINLAPNAEVEIPYSQAPLMSGYTWFTVVNAISTNGGSVQIVNEGNNILFPFPLLGTQQLIQPLYAMLAKSGEERELRNAFFVAGASLVIIAVFQIADWVIRFTFHI
jgi:hypothetical protein